MDGNLKLNGNEKVLVCGEREKTEAWREVPLRQAQIELRNILQNLAYFEPRFQIQDNKLHIWMGKRWKTTKLEVQKADAILKPARKRKVVDFPLMPAKLNEVEAWANIETQSRGYACAENRALAQVWDSTILLNSNLGERRKVGDIRVTESDGLDEKVLSRYRPFESGDWYDIRKTELMTQRLLNDGLYQSAYFLKDCQKDQVDLTLQTTIGRPRILRFEIGGSTEEFPFAALTFRNTRLDDLASNFTATLRVSPRESRLELLSELYAFQDWPRIFFGPRFRIAHQIERAYEINSVTAGLDLGSRWDSSEQRWLARWGPTLNSSRTVRGLGPSDISYPSFEGILQVMTHDYEYFRREQSAGWLRQLFYRGQNRGLGSQVDVNRLRLTGKSLWNLGLYSPPLWVLGVRFEASRVDVDRETRLFNRNRLPVEERLWFGGDDNLRGFPRQSLDNQGRGYLSALYAGFELRLVEELPWRLQPFLLWDWARLGDEPSQFDPPQFVSEGFGLRWASPFGTLRGSVAKGRIWNGTESTREDPEEVVIFLSFGQEF